MWHQRSACGANALPICCARSGMHNLGISALSCTLEVIILSTMQGKDGKGKGKK